MLNREIPNNRDNADKKKELVQPLVIVEEEEKIEREPVYEKIMKEEFQNHAYSISDEKEPNFYQKNSKVLLAFLAFSTGGYGLFSLLQNNETVDAKTNTSPALVAGKEEKTKTLSDDNKVFIPLASMEREKHAVLLSNNINSSEKLTVVNQAKEEKSFDEKQILMELKKLEKYEAIKVVDSEKIETRKVEVKNVVYHQAVTPPKKIKVKSVKKRKSTKKRIVTIKSGDTLASLAGKFYGDPMAFKHIIYANSSIRNSKSRLRVGQKISIPYLKGNHKRRFVIVRKGNTLASIAKKFYGSVNKIQYIVDANYKIKNQNSTIHLGQKIYLPK